ncbi:MAG: hypothetical protein ACRDTC_21040 [Pseudonocardiaceae bacterium]
MTTEPTVLPRIATDPGMTPTQPSAVSLPLPLSGNPVGEALVPAHDEVGEPIPLTPPSSPCSIQATTTAEHWS